MMNKVPAGEIGHLDYAKKMELLKVLLDLFLVAAIFITGLIVTGGRKNWFTLIAVLGCLPLARYAVNWIVRIPYRSVSASRAHAFQKAAGEITMLYDLVFTTKEKNYAVEAVAIYDNTICAFTSHEKTIPLIQRAEKYLIKYLHDEGYRKISLKIYDDQEDFMKRLEEMAAHANYPSDPEEQEKIKSKEARMAHALTCISL